MKQSSYIQLALASLSLALLSCTTEHEPEVDQPKGVPAEIEVTINEMSQPMTRRNVDTSTDSWTTKSFGVNDRIGMLSTNGLATTGESNDPQANWLKNDFMEYYQSAGSSSYRFRNDALVINTGLLTGKVGRYVYFPYTDEMPVPLFAATNASNGTDYTYYYANPSYNTNNIKAGSSLAKEHLYKEGEGLLLRTPPGADGIVRCVDYMYISNISLSNGALSGGFYHGFCEMIILRGSGFEKVHDDPRKNEIWVVLDYGHTRLTLTLYYDANSGQYSFRPRLWPSTSTSGKGSWYDEDYIKDGKKDGLTQEEAKRWQAWKGQDYIDSKDDLPVPREAWYVILPSAHSYSHTVANYIEIYNNDGQLCQVSNFDLYVNPDTGVADKQMRPGYRFAVEVMMTELGATARPVDISEWSDDDGMGGEEGNNITDVRTVGIKNAGEYAEWVQAYNEFIYNIKGNQYSRPSDKEELEKQSYYAKLSPFGDYNFSDGRWQFYITDDFTLDSSFPQITELQDLLEGVSQVSNYTISNLGGTLIGSISGPGGELRNLDFANLYVKATANTPTGALTNRLDGGTIANCNINNGTMVGGEGPIGLLCGTVNDGTVKNCSVSGAVIGETDNGLFGSIETAPTTSNNDTAGLIIRSLQ